MGDQNSENKVVQEAVHLQCGLAPKSPKMWKKWKKFVYFTNRHFCHTDFHIWLPDASHLNSSFGMCIEHLLHAGHCGRYGEWLNTIPAIKDLLKHTHTWTSVNGVQRKGRLPDCWGSHRRKHMEEVSLPQPCPQQHVFIISAVLGTITGRKKKKKKAVNWLPQLRRNKKKATFPPLSSMLNTNKLVKRWMGSPRMWTDVRIFVTHADDE